MDLRDKTVMVIGSGISGTGAIEMLERLGADTVLYDSNEKLDEESIRGRLRPDSRTRLIFGKIPEDVQASLSLVILSPGVPVDLPVVEAVEAANIPVWGEVELAYQFGKGRIAAITGTNGKTTTTTLVGEIMKAAYPEVYVVGNIGRAYTGAALEMTDKAVTVAEISSFQLETVEDFHPQVSAILNITPDHLDRHHTMQNYIDAKERIARNQKKADTCVLNYDDEYTRDFGTRTHASVIYFSRQHILDKGVYLEGDTFIYSDGSEKTAICKIGELKLLGAHNYENVMAAIGISVAMGVSCDIIRNTILSFTGVEHRIEFVEEKKGVAYYNDSKGTNTDAAIKAVEAMTRPTVLIGGGYDKHVEFDEWIKVFGEKVKWMVLIGATAKQIARTAEKYGFTSFSFADTLEEAVKACAEKAESGDAVLLSPACASWGMFDNYEQRGRLFKDYVRALPD